MIDRRLFLLGSLAAAGCATIPPADIAAADVPRTWGPLTPGPYFVGISVDRVANGSRQIQRWRWFPAVPGSGTAMTAGDLGRMYVAGGGAGWPTDPRAIYATGYDEPGDAEKFAMLMDLPVAARAGARHAQGSFPLVVIGQGFGYESPFHQHVLAEYLASWGYRIATTPLTGPAGVKTDVSPATLGAEVDDIVYLASTEPRGPGLGLVGFDLGGMAVVAAAGSGRVKPNLVVGIDTGLMSEKLTADLITSRPDFAWERLTMPYVHFTRTAAENVARALPETLKIFEQNNGAPRALIRVPAMRHADFAAIGAIENVHPALYGQPPGDAPAGHASTVFLIRDALDHFVRRHSRSQWTAPVTAPITIQRWN